MQHALVFLLGFLCAAFLVLLAAPLFWRRAHFLWQKSMVARLPLSLTAIEADRDLLRASHAVELRKAEMQTSLIREKQTQALLKISADRAELEKLPQMQQKLDIFRVQQQNDRHQLSIAQGELKTLQNHKQSSLEENGRLQRQNEALSKLSDTLRLDVTARDIETDRLRREAGDHRQEKKQLNSAKSELASQVAALKTSLESEKKRNQALEEKLHRLITELSDTQEKLERQRRDIISKDIPLRHILSASDKQALNSQDKKLRETISELAAEMVAKTAAEEGENSPIHALLKQVPEAHQATLKENLSASVEQKTAKSKNLAARIKKHKV